MKKIRLYDNIVAISTPLGKGAIAIIRLSGKDAFTIIEKKFLSVHYKKTLNFYLQKKSKRVYGYFFDSLTEKNQKIDEILLHIFYSPYSYTGENLIEIHSHGNPLITSLILQSLQNSGARIAYPGEFSKRAYLNNRMELTQVEAIHELMNARNREVLANALAHLDGKFSKKMKVIKKLCISILAEFKVYIDYPDENLNLMNKASIRLKIKKIFKFLKTIIDNTKKHENIKKNYQIAILGKANVGKSSFFNFIVSDNRSIVSDKPGTTRDYIEKEIALGNLQCNFVDMAGIRLETKDEIESLGQKKIPQLLRLMDKVIWLFDYSRPFDKDDERIYQILKKIYPSKEALEKKLFLVINKIDQQKKIDMSFIKEKFIKQELFFISIKQKKNLKAFIQNLSEKILNQGEKSIQSDIFACNLRQKKNIIQIAKYLKKIYIELKGSYDMAFLIEDMDIVLENLSEILGEISNDSVYDYIFTHFCLGK